MNKLANLTDGQLVQLVQLVEKAKKRIPDELRQKYGRTGLTWFSENDRWIFLESNHPNMCKVCEGYANDVFRGDQLQKEFPYCEALDRNYVYPKVHPNCHCSLVRLFTLDPEADEYVEVIHYGEDPMLFNNVGRPREGYRVRETKRLFKDERDFELAEITGYEALDQNIDIRIEVLAVMDNDDLDPDAIERLLGYGMDDFMATLEAMTYVGYVTKNLVEDLTAYRQYREGVGGLATDIMQDWMVWRQIRRRRKKKKQTIMM